MSILAAHIFVCPKIEGQSLGQFASEIYTWLHMSFEERMSYANQSEETFYSGTAAGLVVEIWENPKRTYTIGRCLEDYPFLIGMEPEGSKQSAHYLSDHAHILARRLSHDGFRCFVPKDWTSTSEKEGFVYDTRR